jgi:paraquat-inducible protein A
LEYDEIIITEAYPKKARQLRYLIGLSAIMLAVGLVAPIATLNKFILVQNTFSVLSGVLALFSEGQFFLFLLISCFSVLLPVLKLGVLYRLVSQNSTMREQTKRLLHWMHLYGKWSMLDVFVVAVLVVLVKLGAIANVEMRYGLYAFAASVLLTMFVTARIVSLTSEPH